jgi:chromosome segregation ATPase
MEFKTIEEAKEYVNKIEAENKNLNDLLENQKVAMTEKENNITSLNEEINRLKIKNYELFEQIPVSNNNSNNNPSSKKDVDNEIDIDYLLKNFDN